MKAYDGWGSELDCESQPPLGGCKKWAGEKGRQPKTERIFQDL